MNNQDSLYSGSQSDTNEAWGLASNYNYGHFPKEYQRNLIDTLDKRFLVVWMISFVVHFSGAFYFSMHPPKTGFEQSQIDRIQKQFVTMVLERENVPAVTVEPDP